MKPNETLKKEITFNRKIRLSKNDTVNALDGMYEVTYSFELHDEGAFLASVPVELKNNKQTDILTINKAREMAKENKEVKEWFTKQEDKNLSVESEEAILSQGMWTVAFHSVYKESVKRIVINMDAETGDIKAVHHEDLGKDALKFLD
ncbi:hypothetical protein V1502_10580 [Bacillus sp. SCS-153A]|uniref:hypothetical protein n=1 Tax=Rossellomorea sedimentorum TaxID=3115294 RepID=UPI0039067A1C